MIIDAQPWVSGIVPAARYRNDAQTVR